MTIARAPSRKNAAVPGLSGASHPFKQGSDRPRSAPDTRKKRDCSIIGAMVCHNSFSDKTLRPHAVSSWKLSAGRLFQMRRQVS